MNKNIYVIICKEHYIKKEQLDCIGNYAEGQNKKVNKNI